MRLIYSPLRRSDGWSFTPPEIMKAIKGRSARLINLALKRMGPVWQEVFFDHVLRWNDSLVDRIDRDRDRPHARPVAFDPLKAGSHTISGQ